jgi:hypothetical protein
VSEEKVGIDNLETLFTLPIELGKFGFNVINGKVVNPKHWFDFAYLFSDALNFLHIDWKMLKEEYKDLSAEEMVELESFIISKLNISDDKIKIFLQRSLQNLVNIQSSIQEAIEIYREHCL